MRNERKAGVIGELQIGDIWPSAAALIRNRVATWNRRKRQDDLINRALYTNTRRLCGTGIIEIDGQHHRARERHLHCLVMDIALGKNREVKWVVVLCTCGCAIAVKGNEKAVLIIAKIVVVDVATNDVRGHRPPRKEQRKA